jgi:hypothetical protein
VVNVNFRGASLQEAIFRGTILGANFTDANIIGAHFGRSRFSHGNTFDNVKFDETTDFEDAQATRPVSRDPVFQFFSYERGKFRRKSAVTGREVEEARAAPDAQTTDLAVIQQRLASNPTAISAMATSLSLAIKEEIELLQSTKPNDPQALERHEQYLSLMNQVAHGLKEIAQAISRAESAQDASSKAAELGVAARVVSNVRAVIADWLTVNGATVFDYGVKTGLLGAGCAFLTLCGAPSWQAFPALAVLLGLKSVVDAVKGTPKSPDR